MGAYLDFPKYPWYTVTTDVFELVTFGVYMIDQLTACIHGIRLNCEAFSIKVYTATLWSKKVTTCEFGIKGLVAFTCYIYTPTKTDLCVFGRIIGN